LISKLNRRQYSKDWIAGFRKKCLIFIFHFVQAGSKVSALQLGSQTVYYPRFCVKMHFWPVKSLTQADFLYQMSLQERITFTKIGFEILSDSILFYFSLCIPWSKNMREEAFVVLEFLPSSSGY